MIQLARRCVRSTPVPTVSLPKPLQAGDFDCSRVAAPEGWTWGADGAFQFRSSIQTAAEKNNTVFGRFFPVTTNWKNYPTAILVHGWNAEVCYHRLFPSLAERFKKAGLNCATIELPYHMQRRPKSGPATDFISSDLGQMLEAARQAVVDLSALSRWLQGEGNSRIGVWGFSLGAWLAALAARSEKSFRFLVLTTPIARIDRVIEELPFCAPIRIGLQGRQFDLGSLNLAAEPLAIEMKRVLLVQSRHDLFAPAGTIEELWRAWKQPEMWRLPHGHISLLMSQRTMARTIDWIQQHYA